MNEIVTIQQPPTETVDALPASAIKAQVQLIQDVMKTVMKEGEHYGVIPGCAKPSLLKPGAEKLCLTFRLDPEYTSTERYEGEHLFIKSHCTLYHSTSGRRLGSGEGSCSTKEAKYAYRQGLRLCPKCGKDAIIKGKAEYGGGWLCFQKKGGCGTKWKDGAQEIEGQSTERVPNEDLPDSYNTILKMANKRSLIAAVLNVTAASDIFTQDMEDQKVAVEAPSQGTVGGEQVVELPSGHTATIYPQGAMAELEHVVADWKAAIDTLETKNDLDACWEAIVKDGRIPMGSTFRQVLYKHYQARVKQVKAA